MKDISLDDIFLVRNTAMEMISQRGFNVDRSTKCISKDRLSIMYQHFISQIGKKNRSSILDIHILNEDSQAYIAWCPDTNIDNNIKKIGKEFRETCNPGEYDDLIIIMMSRDVPNENLLSYESSNVTIFSIANLTVNITKHSLVPRHRVLDINESNKILKRLRVTRGNIPQINRFYTEEDNCKGDPVARFYGMRSGDIVEITRRQKTSGDHNFYREVVGLLPQKAYSCYCHGTNQSEETVDGDGYYDKGY